MASSGSSGGGISFGGAFFLVLLVLKLTGSIDWSWWWVTAPLWGTLVLVLVIVAVYLAIPAIRRWRHRRQRRAIRKMQRRSETSP